MRLEIFKHLLPDDPSIQIRNNLWNATPGSELLMLTSKRIGEEATELFFQNVVQFQTKHEDLGGKVRAGVSTLCGFDAIWRTSSRMYCATLEDRLSQIKHNSLQDYLKNVRHLNISQNSVNSVWTWQSQQMVPWSCTVLRRCRLSR